MVKQFKIDVARFNDLRIVAVALVENLRQQGKDSLMFQQAVQISNTLIDIEDENLNAA